MLFLIRHFTSTVVNKITPIVLLFVLVEFDHATSFRFLLVDLDDFHAIKYLLPKIEIRAATESCLNNFSRPAIFGKSCAHHVIEN